MLALTQRRSHKTGTERATSTAKGNAAYAAMEAVIMAREWQEEAKRVYDMKYAEAAEDEEIYKDAIRRTLEKTEALEKHVKTVTMRADSLVTSKLGNAAWLTSLMLLNRLTLSAAPRMPTCSPTQPHHALTQTTLPHHDEALEADAGNGWSVPRTQLYPINAHVPLVRYAANSLLQANQDYKNGVLEMHNDHTYMPNASKAASRLAMSSSPRTPQTLKRGTPSCA